MRKTRSKELSNLKTFLNLDLNKEKVVAKLLRSHFPAAALPELATAQKDLGAAQERISRCLYQLHLEVFEPIPPAPLGKAHTSPREMLRASKEAAFFTALAGAQALTLPSEATNDPDSKKQLDAFMNRAKQLADDAVNNPTAELYRLVDALNLAEGGAQWLLLPAKAAEANLSYRKKSWRIERHRVGAAGLVFGWLATILERNQLSQLAACRTCNRFFIPTVPWQKNCSERCKKFFDSKMSRVRKRPWRAKKRATQNAKQQQREDRQQKAKLLDYLKSDEFWKACGRGPNERAKNQKREVERLQKAFSVQEYVRDCDPEILRKVNAWLEYRRLL